MNLGGANRISMATLRDALIGAGLSGVRTHGQSGNVVADAAPDAVVAAIRAIIDVPCVSRTAGEWSAAIAANPFGDEASRDPKRLQVTFRAEPADPGLEAALSGRCAGGERVAVRGREIYTWHPNGVAGSKLAQAVTPAGVPASARNWNTVLAIGELAGA